MPPVVMSDVYKRQEQARAILAAAAPQQPVASAQSEADRIMAVSYTHLDVYERQSVRCIVAVLLH